MNLEEMGQFFCESQKLQKDPQIGIDSVNIYITIK